MDGQIYNHSTCRVIHCNSSTYGVQATSPEVTKTHLQCSVMQCFLILVLNMAKHGFLTFFSTVKLSCCRSVPPPPLFASY
jgi:hypothetical protein